MSPPRRLVVMRCSTLGCSVGCNGAGCAPGAWRDAPAEQEVLRPGLKGLLLELGTSLDRAGGVVAGSQGPKGSLLELSLALGGPGGARRGPKGDR